MRMHIVYVVNIVILVLYSSNQKTSNTKPKTILFDTSKKFLRF